MPFAVEVLEEDRLIRSCDFPSERVRLRSEQDGLRMRLAERLRGAGIRFAITSGMACVHYGLQQTTKDSDWVILPEDFTRFRDLLAGLEQESRWGISYRPIFGAPLESHFMRHGWTSHLLITEPDGKNSV